MKLTIQNNFGKFDKNTWVKDADKLEVQIFHTFSPILELYAVVNGETHKIINNKLTITKFVNDEYKITIKAILNGKVLKNVPCETLKVIKIDDAQRIIPEIYNLELKIKETEQQCAKKINDIENLFSEKVNELQRQNELLKAENEKLKEFIQNDIGEEEDE